MRKLLLASAALIALAAPASAAPIELFLQPLPVHFPAGQQANITGCIIAGTNCGQQTAGFPYTNFTQGGAIHTYNEASPVYTAGQLVTQVGGAQFNVGIDVNIDHAATETLLFFKVVDLDKPLATQVLYEFDGVAGSNNIGVASSPGNGWSDYRLFRVDLGLAALGVHVGDHIQFLASWQNANAGAESFFIFEGGGPKCVDCEPNPQAVPGPVVGAGLPGLIAACFTLLGLARNRRKANA